MISSNFPLWTQYKALSHCRRIQNRKLVGIVALIIAFAMCGAVATAQQPTKVPRIGYVQEPAIHRILGLTSRRCAKGCEISATSREKTL